MNPQIDTLLDKILEESTYVTCDDIMYLAKEFKQLIKDTRIRSKKIAYEFILELKINASVYIECNGDKRRIRRICNAAHTYCNRRCNDIGISALTEGSGIRITRRF